MDLKEIVSIAGIGGLKKIVKQRPDGLIISEMDGSGKKFMSNRIHMFTPLENISIYTDTDSEALANVFWKMKSVSAEHPPIAPNSSAEDLKAYLAGVLPNYDRDQVFVSDIKKLIKWYAVLDGYGMITDPEEKKEEEKEEAGQEDSAEASAEEAAPETNSDED